MKQELVCPKKTDGAKGDSVLLQEVEKGVLGRRRKLASLFYCFQTHTCIISYADSVKRKRWQQVREPFCKEGDFPNTCFVQRVKEINKQNGNTTN